MGQTVFRQAVSLGQNCRPKYQLRRVFGLLAAGRRGVFDWQITPDDAVLEYLRRDFRGLFERRDLEIDSGLVRNTRFGTVHIHEFPKGDLTSVRLDELYAAARTLHDQWCLTTRLALRSRLPTLFVLGRPLPPETLREIEALIRTRRRRRAFHLLPAPDNDITADSHWTGNAEVWSRHLVAFSVEAPLSVRVGFRIHVFRKRLRDRLRLATE